MTEETRRGYKILISDQSNTASLESAISTPEAAALAVVQPDGAEFLVINGKEIPFVKNDEGYHIYFLPPSPSLIEAARNFVDTQREIVE